MLSNKLFQVFLVFVIFILGFGARLYKINTPLADWHSWRQADTASVTKIFLEKEVDVFYPRYLDVSSIQTGIFNPEGFRMVEFPVFNIIHLVAVKIFNSLSFDAAGRLVSIIFSMVSTILLFIIAKKTIGTLGGIISAFFFAILPYNIYFSRVILPEPTLVTFLLFSLLMAIYYKEKGKFIYLFISSLFFALGLLIKPFAIFYIVPLLYLFFQKNNFKINLNLLSTISVFSFLSFTPFLLWRIWVNGLPEGIPFFDWAFNGDLIRFHPAFWRWIFAERLGNLILGIWGLPIFVLGVLRNKGNKFVHMFLLGMFFYVAVVATANVRHDYYQIMTIPAICLALGLGIVEIIESDRFGKTIKYIILGFSIILMIGTSFYQVKEFYMINHPEIIEAGGVVKKISKPNDLVVAPYNGDTAFLYATGRSGWPAIDEDIEDIIKKGAKYYVSVDLGSKDTLNFKKRFSIVEEKPNYIILDLTKRI